MTFSERVEHYRARIEMALERALPPPGTHPPRFHAAIRYAVLGGGKRLRPLLTYAAGEWLGLEVARLDAIAVAIELVHAYSLVHDDLPAMDDDELRRGRATTHIAFDDATAILVGDALQAHAYNVLATDGGLAAAADIRRQLVVDLALASGSRGMAGGQAMDMDATAGNPAAATIEEIYELKTGRLLRAAVLMPCRLRPALGPEVLDSADRFGRALGLAFQVADDLIDIESPAAAMGKPQGSDIRNQKATLPSVIGLEATRRRLADLRAEAHDALARNGPEADGLRWVCERVATRDR